MQIKEYLNKVFSGEALEILQSLPDSIVDCCITSPPYWSLRNYEHPKQIGMEKTPEEYVDKIRRVFRQVQRVLKDTGTLWLNIDDTYSGSSVAGRTDIDRKFQYAKGTSLEALKVERDTGLPPKCLVGIPWRVALGMQHDGWILRSDNIWEKPNAMCELVYDRCTREHEYFFHFAKSQKYYYKHEEMYERRSCPLDGERKGRSVWSVNNKSGKGTNYAIFPEELIKPIVLACCPTEGIVLDPFIGTGTVGKVALKLKRNFIGIDLKNAEEVERNIYKSKPGFLSI